MTIPWNDSFKIGDAEIDAQHQNLFALINSFLEATSEGDIKRHAMGLYQYTREHFEHEENLMRRIQYPDMAAHVAEHNQLISGLNVVSLRISDGTLIGHELESFLASWLVDHIKKTDMKLATHFT